MTDLHFIALADAALPIFFIEWPIMLFALIPVIVVEAVLVRRWVPLSYWEAFIGIGLANALSTVFGVPLAWLAMQLAIMLPMGMTAEKWNWNLHGPVFRVIGIIMSSALIWGGSDDFKWMIPAGLVVLLIPCFYLSVWIESPVCLRIWKNANPAEVRRGVYRANLASYLLLFILTCGWICYVLYSKKP
jgi:hypothetical protein